MARSTRIAILAAAAALALAACETDSLPAAESAAPGPPVQTLGSALAQCTIDHGYDPAEAAGLAPSALGDGEQDWRACAHAALERVVRPGLREPHALDALITEDLRLTEAIAAGTATRDDRTAAVAARVHVMQSHERVIREQEIGQLSAAALMNYLDTGGDAARVDDQLDLIRRSF